MAQIDGAIAERARTQLGLITVTDLRALGASRSMMRTRVADGRLVRMANGVMAVGGYTPTWQQRLLALVLAAGPDAVVSHAAAAAWWRFAGVRPGAVEATVPRTRRPRPGLGRIHLARDLTEVDIDRTGLLPVTTPERTLIDVASRFGPRFLEGCLDESARTGQIGRERLERRIEALGGRGRPGPASLTAMLELSPGPRPESWLERSMLRLLARSGLPRPTIQVPIVVGGHTFRVDMLFAAARLIVEVDGHGTHATRRERQADAERRALLTAAGYEVVVFTYEDVVERPVYVVETVRARLMARSGDVSGG